MNPSSQTPKEDCIPFWNLLLLRVLLKWSLGLECVTSLGSRQIDGLLFLREVFERVYLEWDFGRVVKKKKKR